MHNSGNTQKITLVLNFYAFHRRKNTCNPPTMMTLSAAGGPRRHRSWVPDLSSIPEDEVVWVFQDPPIRLCTISLLPHCGTHRTVAADVEKFPFRHLRIKRILAALRSTQTTMMPLPLTTPPPSEHHTTCDLHSTTTETTTIKRPPVDLEAINRQIISNIQSLRRMSERLQQQPSTTTTMMTTPHPAPQPTQNTTPTDYSNPLKITDTTTHMRPTARLLLPTTTTTTTQTPFRPPLQQDFTPPPYSPELQQQQTVLIENDLQSTRNNMESDQPFTTALPPPAPPDDGAPFSPSEPSQRPLPTAPATPVMPIRSRMERLLNNIQDNPIAPWMPDAVYRRNVLHLSGEQDLFPAHHTERDTSTLYVLENIPLHHNNPIVASYATSLYNPALDIHPTKSGYHQKRPPHHLTQTTYITSPYNPALDIHPTTTDQHMKCHQPHTRLPLAPPVKVCAQHKRPL